jgi:hypothetical protein
MAFRYRKRIKIMPGVALNLSNKGVSTSLGGPGATVNLGRGKATSTVGLPGTGLSWSATSVNSPSSTAGETAGRVITTGLLAVFGGFIGLIVALLNPKPTRKRRPR